MLIVAGMALMLVFTIGGKAARTGFDLGRRALASADNAVAQDEFRTLIDSLQLPPSGADPQSLGLRPFSGDARLLEANAVLARPGHCGPAGPAGVMRLSVVSGADGDALVCQVAFGDRVTVIDARPRRVRLEYSSDGSTWSEAWVPASAWGRPAASRTEQTIFIRLVSSDGRIDLTERATSGPPFLFPPPTPHATPGLGFPGPTLPGTTPPGAARP